MAEDLVRRRTALEFFVIIVAVLIGLVIGKYLSIGIAKIGIPIASGDAVPLALPGDVVKPWMRAA